MSLSWSDLVAFASTLPEVAESTSYGTPALKVKNALMARLRTEDDGALAVRCSAAEKAALVADPDPAFYTIPHYDGSDYLLIDLDRAERDQVVELLDAAWWIAAPARVRDARVRQAREHTDR